MNGAGGHMLDKAWRTKVINFMMGKGQHILNTIGHRFAAWGWKRLGEILNYVTWLIVDDVADRL